MIVGLGPFPPSGPAPEGTVDLGAILREEIYTEDVIAGECRQWAIGALGQAIDAGRWEQAAERLCDVLDSIPLAALVTEARLRWTRGPEPSALGVLVRAARLVRQARGWAARDGVWPQPDEAWFQAHGRPGCEPERPLPPHLELPGHALAARRHEVCGQLARGELAAVLLTSPVPMDPDSQLALGEVRLESPATVAWERCGLAGLVTGDVVHWQDQLQVAPPGNPGPVLQPLAMTALLPGTPARLARGDTGTVGWLLWPAAFHPVAVHPVAVRVLGALDGERDAAAVAAELGGPPDQVQSILDQLVRVGAATAVV